MVSAKEVESLFPELRKIRDASLRRAARETWRRAIERGGWTRIDDLPYSLMPPKSKRTLVEHTRAVVSMAMAVAETRKDLDRDVLLAGAILHDVGRCLQFARDYGKVVPSAQGRLVPHTVSGAALAMAAGLPDEVVHIIACHGDESSSGFLTAEAVVVRHCDLIDIEMDRIRHA